MNQQTAPKPGIQTNDLRGLMPTQAINGFTHWATGAGGLLNYNQVQIDHNYNQLKILNLWFNSIN